MRERTGLRAMAAFGTGLMKISAVPGRYGAWIIFVLTFVVLFSVTGAQLGWSHLTRWETSIPLFGTQLNMTSVAELQWHLFAVLVMLAGAYTMREDQHIRVDVVSQRLSVRGRLLTDVLGDLLMLIPFFALLFWFSLDFVKMSYNFAEQSNSGGLIDRYLVKAILPIGSALLLLCAVGRVIRNVAYIIDPALRERDVTTAAKDDKNEVAA